MPAVRNKQDVCNRCFDQHPGGDFDYTPCAFVHNVAASALAATVLTGGRTARSTFRIPIPASSSSLCGVKAGERQLIREAAIIFYDAISMISIGLREMKNHSMPFGEKIIVFLGDFKQLLPVMPSGQGDATCLATASCIPTCYAGLRLPPFLSPLFLHDTPQNVS
jgi:hypothetical protein